MSGKKFDDGKAPWHLLPYTAITEVIKVLQHGAIKYGEFNWMSGLEYSRVYSALMRHLTAWWQGEDKDPETGLSHLAHVACNALFLLTFILANRNDLDNRPCMVIDEEESYDDKIIKAAKKRKK